MSTRVPHDAATVRRSPRQARSQATVAVILDAAARVLGQRGWSGLTTNHVAQVAGVSVGSLYQYFPHKQALVEAVKRRHFEVVLAALRDASDTALPLDTRVRLLVEGMIAAHEAPPGLHHALLEETPRGAEDGADSLTFQAEYLRLYRALLTPQDSRHIHCDTCCDIRTDAMARVLAAAVEGAVHDAAMRGALRSDAFKEALEALIAAYLNVNGSRPTVSRKAKNRTTAAAAIPAISTPARPRPAPQRP